jgi:membrane protein YqaA with SNARE-associated domain
MKWTKNIYNWVLDWSESPYGTIALFFLAFTESFFFPVPPDILLIALALGTASKSFKFAVVCLFGSVSGAFIGYGIGHFACLTSTGGFTSFAYFIFSYIPGFSHEFFYRTKTLFNQWDFWIIFTAGFAPIPYKYFTISSGVFDMNLPLFFMASLISRSIRYFFIAWLVWKFGHSIKHFIDKYFKSLAFGFTFILIGGFILIRIFT